MTKADFDYLLVRHGEILHPYAFGWTKNTEDAEDLYQETMLRALMYRDKYQFGTNLNAWLYTMMRHIFINRYHREQRRRTTGYDDALQADPKMVVQNEGWMNMRLSEIKRAIDSLPAQLRISFELYYTGYKYKEIAHLLSEPVGTIKSRIHFARKMLTGQLER